MRETEIANAAARRTGLRPYSAVRRCDREEGGEEEPVSKGRGRGGGGEREGARGREKEGESCPAVGEFYAAVTFGVFSL
eukprot:1305226-Rhodomonas_salina.1